MEWLKKINSTRQNKKQLSCLSFSQIPTATVTNGIVNIRYENWKFCSINFKLRNGIGNQYQQILNAKCGMLGVLKPMYLFSRQKSTFLLTNEGNSNTKTWNSKIEKFKGVKCPSIPNKIGLDCLACQ